MNEQLTAARYYADFDPEGVPAIFMQEGECIILVDYAKSLLIAKKTASALQKKEITNKKAKK